MHYDAERVRHLKILTDAFEVVTELHCEAFGPLGEAIFPYFSEFLGTSAYEMNRCISFFLFIAKERKGTG